MPDQAEEKSRPGALGQVIRSLLLLAVLGLGLAAAAFYYAQDRFTAKGPLQASKIVTIKRGTRTEQIANDLHKQGVISNPSIFLAATYVFRSSRGSLKAGEYEIPKRASMAQVLRQLQEGKALVHKVTIPEGWTTQQALERIAANNVLTGKLSERLPEGALLPDTYVFQRGLSRDALIKRMRDAQKKLVDHLWAKRAKNLPFKTRAQALILASIVERETGIATERGHVAAVFINRLNKKMRLQSDPTIIYGIVGGKGKMDRPLSKKDIAQKTKYNTYQIDGLPPTPIANPGKAAIAAVLNPDKSDDLYFVADGSGGHVFAKTLKDHEANVAKWRKVERERKKKKKTETNSQANGKAKPASASAAASATPIQKPGKAKKAAQ